MKYDTKQIMLTAWAKTRDAMEWSHYAPHQLRDVFRYHLQRAWRAAVEARADALWFASLTVEKIRSAIMGIENRNGMRSDRDRKLLRGLEAALRERA